MNFTFSALKASQTALTCLRDRVSQWRHIGSAEWRTTEAGAWRSSFIEHVYNDLDLPRALATTWDMIHSSIPDHVKLDLLLEFDQVLGLNLDHVPALHTIPQKIESQVEKRNGLRSRGAFEAADKLRSQMLTEGYVARDTGLGTWVRPKTALELKQERFKTVSSSKEVYSNLDAPSLLGYSIVLVVADYLEDAKRCSQSFLKWASGYSAELVVVDNGSTDGTAEWLEQVQQSDSRVRVIHCDHIIGDAAAKNIGLMQSLGEYVVLLDPSVEVVGDILGPISQWLQTDGIGMVGPWGLRSQDLHHFHEEVLSGEADAMQAYCLAIRRNLIREVGMMRECFRFYRNLDLDFSFQIKDKGYRILACDNLPVVRHEHRQWAALAEPQRDELSAKNFKRFLKRWGDRTDLLMACGSNHEH